MRNNKLIIHVFFICVAITLTACQEKGKNNEAPVDVNRSTSSKEATEEPISQEELTVPIDYNQLQLFRGSNGLYEFKAPRGLFKLAGDDIYISNQLDASITVFTNYTGRFDQTGFFKLEDLIQKFEQGRTITYSTAKNNWFVLSGYDQQNNLFYLKGYYDEMISMQGREEGEPSWLWSKSGVIYITYPEKFREEFDRLVPSITKSFSCDFENF
jgi:hypothetical protein